MSNRAKKIKMYHVRYIADFLVPATSTREAFDTADEEMISMVEGDELELDDIFTISIENENFHVVDIAHEEEDDNGDDNGDDEDDEDDEDEGNDEDED